MLKILIVEDSTSAQKQIKSILKPYAQCILATNGKIALEKVEEALKAEEPFDLIITDVIMPEMDGLSAAKRIRELEQSYALGKRQIIIVLTVVQKPKNILQAQYECGADAYISKPYTRTNVLETINNCGFELKP